MEEDIDGLTEDVKSLKSVIKDYQKLYENLPEDKRQQVLDKMKETKSKLRDKQNDLDDKKDDLKDIGDRVKQLKKERKDPGFAKAKREEAARRRREERIDRAVQRAQGDVEDMLGKGSDIPSELRSDIAGRLDAMDDDQIESFSMKFQGRLKELQGKDPASEEAIAIATKAAKFGDLYGLEDPDEIANRLAELSYARNVVADPMRVGGKPVGVTEMDDDVYADRASESFKQFQNLPSALRSQAAAKAQRELQGLDPETNRARELNAILTGMNVAHVAATGDSLPGRPQPSKGVAALMKRMAETGNVDQLFRTSEDYFAEQARLAMRDRMDDMDALDIAKLSTDDDEEHPYYGMQRLIESEVTPDVMKAMMKDYLIQDMLNDMWGDRAVRDTMEAAGIEDADDPEVRAKVQRDAKKKTEPRLSDVTAAQRRIAEAEQAGAEPDADDVELVQGFMGEEGTGLREQAKALLDTIKDRFQKTVVSPATAVLNHFIQTGDSKALEQETLPHPDEKAKEPRPKEEREKTRADREQAKSTDPSQMSPKERLTRRVRLKSELSKLKSQRGKVRDEARGGFDEKIKKLEEDLAKFSEPEKGKKPAKPEKGEPAGPDAEARKPSEADEAEQDEEHGPGDVWQTEQGNWRAKNRDGQPKSFKSKDEAERYSKGPEKAEDQPDEGDAKPEDSTRGGEAPGEEFTGELGDFEERGPTRLASGDVVDAWLRKVRACHPDAPNRPLVVVDAA
jgi:hypothetical protein